MNIKRTLHCRYIVGTTTLGERGQVVIPKELRRALKLKSGHKFIVMNHDQMIMLAPESLIAKFSQEIAKALKILK